MIEVIIQRIKEGLNALWMKQENQWDLESFCVQGQDDLAWFQFAPVRVPQGLAGSSGRVVLLIVI